MTLTKSSNPKTLPLVVDTHEFHEFLLQQQKSKTPNINKSDIRIIDLSSEASYIEGHVPGAVHIPFQALMSGEPPAPGKLPDTERLNQVFSYLGLNSETHFVVYDDEGGGWAGRFIWTLDVIGHSNYSYLDGGILAWKDDQLPLETHVNKPPSADVHVNIQQQEKGPIAEIAHIMEGIKDKSVTILDARSPQEYRGEKVLAKKGGHIPGAINCEWTSLMDKDRAYRIRTDAKEYLHSLGFHKDQHIITHCQSHHRSGFTYLVGKTLGFNIRGYHGSWSEWGNQTDTPVEI